MGQSPEELEAERRLAAEEAERARQAVIEAKVMEVSISRCKTLLYHREASWATMSVSASDSNWKESDVDHFWLGGIFSSR